MKEETNSGWVKLHRSILRWEWWDDANTARVFIYCLLKANPVPKKWHGITIERGTFVTSLATIAKDTGLTVQQTRTALNRLKSTHEITSESTNKITAVTITNYERYQQQPNPEQQAEQQTIQQTNNKQITNEQQTNNNNEEYKEEKEIKNNLFYDDDARAREEIFFKEKEIGEIYKELLPIYNSETATTNAIRMKVRRDYDITLTPEQVGLYFTKFFETQVAGGIQTANRKDYCLHFASWLYKRIEAAQKKKETQTPKKPALNPRLKVTKGSNKGMTRDF